MPPTILILLGHYEPGFRAGGPIKSIAGLTSHFAKQYRLRIVTSDRDLGMSRPFDGIESDRWIERGGAEVCYLSPAKQWPAQIVRLLRETSHDLLYLNSFFARPWSVMPLLARRMGRVPCQPLLIAPRGEFSDGAAALKRRRKLVYRRLAIASGLLERAHWQASSEFEARDIVGSCGIGLDHIHIARDLAPLPVISSKRQVRTSPSEPLRIVFLSRLSPKKNLDAALRILLRVKSRVNFNIFGTAEDDAYVRQCREIAAHVPPNVEVHWNGPVDPVNVPTVFADHDLFLFPTRGENYGHVIAESLAAGTPVLLSDQTPWRGLAVAGAGHDLPLADPNAFARIIDDMSDWTQQQHMLAKQAVLAYAQRALDPTADIQAHRNMFEAVLRHG